MRLIDLFCCAGGAAAGYAQAGFDVTGVDHKPQPRFPFRFIQADVLSLTPEFLRGFDFIHASPPCQFATSMRHVHNARPHLNLIPPTRALLKASGLPYVIENVVGARPHLLSPIMLCGSMFGLRAPDGAQLRRHRLFEVSGFALTAPPPCRHKRGESVAGVYGGHNRNRRRDRGKNHRPGSNRPWAHAFIAMGVPVGCMTLVELSEAIPPAYARYVAEAFRKARAPGAAPDRASAAPLVSPMS
jgi:DNA (cytosine-5)-methyltransferase 1